jgi:hypothetical protein
VKIKPTIFLSYAHEDEKMKVELDKSLIALKRSGKIDVWQDKEIMAGQEWDQAIKDKLITADIILLLISVDFNNSQYIWEKELAVAMQRHAEGKARVIPIILRPCDWGDMPYAKLQALPDGAAPVSTFEDKDEAYTNIARKIRDVVDYMISSNQ